MAMKKKSASAFIAVLPAMVLAGCAIKTSNPPEPATLMVNPPTSEPTPEPVIPEPATKTVNPPEPQPLPVVESPKYPPVSYSKREKNGKKCYVQVYVNPPYQVEVSCKAPIEPAAEGSKWCSVAEAKDAARKVGVDCASD